MAGNCHYSLCISILVFVTLAIQCWLVPVHGLTKISKRATDKVAFVEAPVNTSTTLTCHPRTIEPPYLISWRKENSINAEFYVIVNSNNNANSPYVAIDYQGRVILADYASLTIKRLKREDTGLWECLTAPIRNGVAINSQQVIIRVQLQVDVPPTVSVGQAIIYSSLSTTITLKCFIDGVPDPNTAWWKKNDQLPSGRYSIDSGQMQVFNLIQQDYGIYVCSANNLLGTASGEILVLPPGNHTVVENHFTAVEGGWVTINCPISVQKITENIIWTFQQSNFDITTFNRFEKLTNGSLLIKGILQKDSGMFSCSIRLSDTFQTRFLPQVKATVNVMFPPRIINAPSTVLASIGYSKILPCQVEANPNITSLKWSQNGVEISSSSRYTLLANGNLRIDAVQPQDANSFSCKAENAIDVTTHTMRLRLVDPPQFLQVPPPSIRSDLGKRVILRCTVKSQSAVVINWKKASLGIVSNSNRTIVVDGILTIFTVDQRDSGSYTCTANNGAVTITTSTQLEILSPPSSPTNVTIAMVAFTSVTLTWSVGHNGGYAQLIQLWYKKVEWLDSNWLLVAQLNSSVNTYTYDQLTPSLRYQFRLRGQNRLGTSPWSSLVWTKMQGYLNNTDEPNPPTGVHAVNGANYIRVIWQPATSQSVTLSHYAIQMRSNGTLEWYTVNITSHSTETQTQLTNLAAFKVYTIRVVAYGQNTVPSRPSANTQILYVPDQSQVPSSENHSRNLVLAFLVVGLTLIVLAIIFFIHREKVQKTINRLKKNGFLPQNNSNSQRSNSRVIDIFHQHRSASSSNHSKNKGKKTFEERQEAIETNIDVAISDLEDLKQQTIPAIVIGTEIDSNLTGMKKFMSVSDGTKNKHDKQAKGGSSSGDENSSKNKDFRTTRVIVRSKKEKKSPTDRPTTIATLDRSSRVMIPPNRYDSLDRAKSIQDKRFSTLPTTLNFMPYESFINYSPSKGKEEENEEKSASRSTIKAPDHEYESIKRDSSVTAISKYSSRSSLHNSQNYAKLEGTVAAMIDTTSRSSEVTHDSLSASFYHTLPSGIDVPPMVKKIRRFSDDSSTNSTSTNSASLPPPISSSIKSSRRRDSSSSVASSNIAGNHHYEVVNRPLKYVTKRGRANKTTYIANNDDLCKDEYGYYQIKPILGKLDEDIIVADHYDNSSGYHSREHIDKTSTGTTERLQYQQAVEEYFSVIDDISNTSNSEIAEQDSIVTKDTADSRSSTSYSPSIETTAESNHVSTTSLSSVSSKAVYSYFSRNNSDTKEEVNSNQHTPSQSSGSHAANSPDDIKSITSQKSSSDGGSATLKKFPYKGIVARFRDDASQDGNSSANSDGTLRRIQIEDKIEKSSNNAKVEGKTTRIPAQSSI
ncbi:Protein turtle-like protein B [Trichoplax sp. H2]|nr:Protein turtle-like protein B [Trichoplax sp. H2]|eukprot:RDD41755.1 Protein turtle-like protein B [Trichoplax sp. H2]